MTGKTDTIKQRRVDVYAPTEESKARWQAAAKAKNIPLSRYAGQILEVYLGEESADLQSELRDARSHIIDIESENGELQRRVEELSVLQERLEKELDAYRSQALLSDAKVKKLDARLVSYIADARAHDGRLRIITTRELQKKLRIPRDDVSRLNALNLQLEVMELQGMIAQSGKGWIWNE